MKKRMAAALTMLMALTGCGGGVDIGIGIGTGGFRSFFLFWNGNDGGDRVIDANNSVFAFYADTGCLFNFQTGRENTAFCLVPGSNVVTYGPFQGQVLNIRSSAGTCVAALVDSRTGNFADVEVDAYGREVVLTTGLRPVLCSI